MDFPAFPAALPASTSDVLVSRWTSAQLRALPKAEAEDLRHIVDAVGVRSAAAQALEAPVTRYKRVLEAPDTEHQALYLATRRTRAGGMQVLGLLRVGVKNLFLLRRGLGTALVEAAPLCLLDFYVCEDEQRSGYGLLLFNEALGVEGTVPEALAYDRPSAKLLAFLDKHFSLHGHLAQENHFTVFEPDFWLMHDRHQAALAASADSQAVKHRTRWASISQRPLTALHKAPVRKKALSPKTETPVPASVWFASMGPPPTAPDTK